MPQNRRESSNPHPGSPTEDQGLRKEAEIDAVGAVASDSPGECESTGTSSVVLHLPDEGDACEQASDGGEAPTSDAAAFSSADSFAWTGEEPAPSGTPTTAAFAEPARTAGSASSRSSSALFRVTDAELEALRQMLFSEELAFLKELKQRVGDHASHAQDMSHVLAEAILLRAGKDDKLQIALQPTVESIVRSSVKKHPGDMATSLFPLMGPAIRKAIAETFNGMLQGFNKTIELVFSWKGLRWRFEALRTGRSFSEVVLIHTLLYQVEQVFLIHSSTGLMLGHAISEGVEHQDGDLVSGMLTAIQDFVKDCFHVGEGDLETLQMGDRTLIVEKGSEVSLALVVRGTLPVDFRNSIRDILDLIHVEMGEELSTFSGDLAPFQRLQHYLDGCLGQRYLDEDKPVPFWLKCVPVLAVLGVLAVPSYFVYEQMRFSKLVHVLDRHSGLVVSGYAGGPLGGWEVFVARDPLSVEPIKILEEQGIDTTRVTIHETPFASLDPEMVTMRLREAMGAPDDVKLAFIDGIVHLEGVAPMNWIQQTKEKALGIPGVKDVDTSKISDPRTKHLKALVEKIESLRIEFPFNKDIPEGEDMQKLTTAVDTLEELVPLAADMGLAATLIIYGHTDSVGTDKRNFELSEKRAKTLASMLYSRGVGVPIATYGFGSEYAKDAKGSTDDERQSSRRIELRIHLSYLGNSLITFDNK